MYKFKSENSSDVQSDGTSSSIGGGDDSVVGIVNGRGSGWNGIGGGGDGGGDDGGGGSGGGSNGGGSGGGGSSGDGYSGGGGDGSGGSGGVLPSTVASIPTLPPQQPPPVDITNHPVNVRSRVSVSNRSIYNNSQFSNDSEDRFVVEHTDEITNE